MFKLMKYFTQTVTYFLGFLVFKMIYLQYKINFECFCLLDSYWLMAVNYIILKILNYEQILIKSCLNS